MFLSLEEAGYVTDERVKNSQKDEPYNLTKIHFTVLKSYQVIFLSSLYAELLYFCIIL